MCTSGRCHRVLIFSKFFVDIPFDHGPDHTLAGCNIYVRTSGRCHRVLIFFKFFVDVPFDHGPDHTLGGYLLYNPFLLLLSIAERGDGLEMPDTFS